MTVRNRQTGRRQFLLIAFVFLGPLLVAAFLYFPGNPLQPVGRTNHGALLEPIVNVGAGLPESAILTQGDRAWLLLYANTGPCGKSCREALHTIRQARLMLGKEMDRVQRVFLHGDSVPDTVLVIEEHQGLMTLKDSSLNSLLNNKRPADLPAGGYFLVDPLGNLVMYFQPDLDPAEMVDDIKHLLRLSRIG